MTTPIVGISQGFVQYGLGAFLGSAIDSIFTRPTGLRHSDAIELVVQVAVNGAVLSLAGKYILSSEFFANDPTNGILFILGLVHSQIGMSKRAENLTGSLKEIWSRWV